MSRFARCVHFKGIQNVCAAGVDPITVRASRVAGAPMATFPCLDTRYPCATTCSLRRMMTDEEALEAAHVALNVATHRDTKRNLVAKRDRLTLALFDTVRVLREARRETP